MLDNFFLLDEEHFSEIELSSSFFDSLRQDYVGFDIWFLKKKETNEKAFIHRAIDAKIDGFLYLKDEDEGHLDIIPHLEKKRRLKIGTFKIDAHGTKLGEYFLRKILMLALDRGHEEVYITVYPKYHTLITLLKKYGFTEIGKKDKELVLLKDLKTMHNDILLDFPRMKYVSNIYILPIFPRYHTSLFSSSKLNNEVELEIQDIAHTNSIHKAYICGMNGAQNLRRGDILVIYRTGEDGKSAEYSAVVTSICVVEEYTNIDRYPTESDFIQDMLPYSVFSEEELRKFYKNRTYPHIIKMMYNIPLKKRITRHDMIEKYGLTRERPNFINLTKQQLDSILTHGGLDANFIIY